MQKEINQETREHILEVASKEFFSKGYGAASINTIVDAADVTKPTVYYHFKNKEGLFKVLVEESYERMFDIRRKAVNEKLSIEKQIAQTIASDFDFCLKQPELVRFILAQTFDLPGETKNDLTEIHYRDYEFFRDLIERGNERGELNCKDTISAALALQGIIDINIVSFLKMNHDTDFLSPKRAKKITKMFLNGINS
ncbi:MAG: TetR/AcrR family transcriptional regulator [Pyrinomonadaceae bacterium]